MKTFSALASALAITGALAAPSQSENNLRPRATLEPITVKGNAFFQGNNRFYVRGIDYQPGGSSNLEDPLANPTICKRDIAKFKELGTNVVRIYSVDNSANHDECMQELADAGIYLVLDTNTPDYSINRADPAPSYNSVYLQNVFATIDIFVKYSNTMAFFSANEVINDDKTTATAPYVKAVTRDMRAYMKARGHRQVPVGYSAADVAESRMEMAHYMNCGTDEERSDFFAFNDYSWCNPSSYQVSGWDQKVKNFTGYGLPIFLSEYGCIKPRPRTFGEVKALYSKEMTPVYSGGLAYEYSMEDNDYGMVEIKSDTEVEELEDFDYYKTALEETPMPTGDGGYNPTQSASECPAFSANWNVTDSKLPAMPKKAQAFFKNGAGKGVGLEGDGSQTVGCEDEDECASGTSDENPTPTDLGPGDSETTETSEGAAAGLVIPPVALINGWVGLAVLVSALGGGLLL